jgi:hypothetical protein
MKAHRFLTTGLAIAATVGSTMPGMAADSNKLASGKIKHVLLLSVDGMHSVDFYNCSHGIAGANGGNPYCPNMAALAQTALNYTGTSTTKPSDSFPGMAALITGGTPKTTGIYYDVAYDRSLDGPAQTTGTGLAATSCTPYAAPAGTTTDNDQGIDLDDTKLNGGIPGAEIAEGGIRAIDPKKLSRNPAAGCAPVYPWNFIRTNTIFGVIHAAGGFTAWADKHPSYAFINGPGTGKNVDDLYTPEVDSNVVPLYGIKTVDGASCDPIRDTTDTSSWTHSFDNIQCYDALKVNAVLKQIAGKTHTGAPSVVPAIFGMNFQSVFVGQAVAEPNVGTGGYLNAAAVPSAELLKEIEYVDTAIGAMVNALKDAGIYDETMVIVTAKHGESPIDPTRYVGNTNTPATLLGTLLPYSESPLNPNGIGATEDDVSVLWLRKGASVTSAVDLLEKNASAIGLGEILYGPTLAPNYGVGGLAPGEDPRTPDIIVTPNYGVTYVGDPTTIEDHGGFGHDDTNVVMLVENPSFSPQTITTDVSTAQIAPTILSALGLDPSSLDAVKAEGTRTLPEVWSQLQK